MRQLFLRPGTPDDNNRDYLPRQAKGTDIVVNENGNNSQPYPKNLKECYGILDEEGNLIADPEGGIDGTWYEYVPDSYTGTHKVPAVFSMHGGLMSGWGQCIYTSWSILAEREGFICVFPNGHINCFWQIQIFHDRKEKPKPLAGLQFPAPAPSFEENVDCNFIRRLMKHICRKYFVDKDRLYMQGMSNGSAMTHQFARKYGNLLAGAACSAVPGYIREYIDENKKLITLSGPVAMWESHPEFNRHGAEAMLAESRKIRESRYYWLTVNKCSHMPKISIIGENNYAFFDGGEAPYVFMDIYHRDHGQTLDEAFLYWDYLFAGSSRAEDGSHIQQVTPLNRDGDAFAAAFVSGVDKILWKGSVHPLSIAPIQWRKLKYHGLNGGEQVMGEYQCVPLDFLAEMCGANLKTAEDTLTAVLTLPDGRRLQFARGSIGCMMDNRLRCMYCEALHRDGKLLISVDWFAEYVMNWTVSAHENVTYVTDHAAHLSTFMADLLIDILTDRVVPENFMEEALLD